MTVLSYLTFFHNYWNPPYVFWDENYHIASAQKYLHGVYFMEQHPPLGKLLVAAGEVMFHPNARTDQFLGTDYGTNFPPGFSFVGYRFFSAFLSWLAAPLFFLIFYLLSRRNPLTACLLSFLYIFDNALVVHARGAMLEGPLLFFVALHLLVFFLLLEYRRASLGVFIGLSLAFGASLGLVLTTKVLGLILILLIPALLWKMRNDWGRTARFAGFALGAFLLVYCSVWYVHFALGSKVNPDLPDNGYYQASDAYQLILIKGQSASPMAFPTMLVDSLKFVGHYNAGAPRLDLCKIDENGSPFYFWPLGARSINYRWETPEGKSYRYLYLQSNPVVWWSVLLGLFVASAMLLASVFFPPRQPLRHRFLMALFVGIYICYMIAVSRISRVMYLYHYFIPLQLGMIVLALVIGELQTVGRKAISENARSIGLIAFAALIFLSFQFYRPLTYYEPMSDEQVTRRAILPLWELHCVNCDANSPLVIPSKRPGE